MAEPLKILLVEDNPGDARLVREMLEQMGCKVFEAHDGAEGVEMAARSEYALILMDISMPGMDGVTATRTIRAAEGPNRTTQIVALTAHAMPEDLERFEAAGVEETLAKPISKAKLANLLARRIGCLAADPEHPLEHRLDRLSADRHHAFLNFAAEVPQRIHRRLQLVVLIATGAASAPPWQRGE